VSAEETVRAWKDPDDRGDIDHPAGDIVLVPIGGLEELFLDTQYQCTVTVRTHCTYAPDCYYAT
jgi:hypothetical protein